MPKKSTVQIGRGLLRQQVLSKELSKKRYYHDDCLLVSSQRKPRHNNNQWFHRRDQNQMVGVENELPDHCRGAKETTISHWYLKEEINPTVLPDQSETAYKMVHSWLGHQHAQ